MTGTAPEDTPAAQEAVKAAQAAQIEERKAAARWLDLKARTLSAVVLLALGASAIWAGGHWFAQLAVLITALMIWELSVMTTPQIQEKGAGARAWSLAGFAALVLGAVLFFKHPLLLAFLPLPAIFGTLMPRRDRRIYLVYALAIMATGFALVGFRSEVGVRLILWIVAVVIVSDVMGYFAGRSLGGPKFWPAVSPKKTWSGTVAGWIGAIGVGLAFRFWGGGWDVVILSPFMAFAGQMGDIAESWIKRRSGVKDSSRLIPGHGGVLDRFDALVGAAAFLLAVAALGYLPVFGG